MDLLLIVCSGRRVRDGARRPPDGARRVRPERAPTVRRTVARAARQGPIALHPQRELHRYVVMKPAAVFYRVIDGVIRAPYEETMAASGAELFV